MQEKDISLTSALSLWMKYTFERLPYVIVILGIMVRIIQH